jgi:hypothetical protein
VNKVRIKRTSFKTGINRPSFEKRRNKPTQLCARKYFKNVFSLIVFFGTEVPIVFIFSSADPQRTAYREVPSQMADHLRTGNIL